MITEEQAREAVLFAAMLTSLGVACLAAWAVEDGSL
jgi:hypothetical protein